MYSKQPYCTNGDDDTGHGNAPPPPKPRSTDAPPVGKPVEEDKK